MNIHSQNLHNLNFIFQIVDPLQVYDNINLGRRIDPLWPDELWRSRGGRNSWKDWLPEEDMEGTVMTQKFILDLTLTTSQPFMFFFSDCS